MTGRALDRHAAGLQVELHGSADEHVRGVAGGAADERAHPRQHLLDVERLRDVIVGAGVDPLHLVRPAVARGQKQHRHGAPVAAPLLEHGEPVEPRQADVEHDRVVGFGVAEEMPLLAVEGVVDDVAGIAQRLARAACSGRGRPRRRVCACGSPSAPAQFAGMFFVPPCRS